MIKRNRGVRPWARVAGVGWVVRYQLRSGCFAVTEQPDEDQEEDGGGVDPRREETIGNVFVSV